ncbi:MAG: tetratricopeptide repeat protein [Gemmatimonadota bacterium]|nr:tetratricopeptide repeat protein [Gemmatimonadota bacterium]
MWGVDFLYYMPAPVQVAFVLLAVLLFVPKFQRLCRICVTSLPFALWDPVRRVWISRALVILIAFAGFVLLSSARNFLGDGYRLMQAPAADKWTSMLRAPLTYTIIQNLHNIGSAIWETVENTYRTYSYASGVLYVLFAFPVANILAKNTLERAVVLAFLLTAGYIQLFFGYVENYALYMPGLLLYLYLGLRTCKDRAHLFLPAFMLGLLLALHRGFFIFGPSLFYLAYRFFRSRQGRIHPWKNALATTAALCCVPASGLLFLTVSGVGVHDYFFRAGGSHFLPLFDEPGFQAQYRIFSLTHISDWLNQQLLATPAACMALFLLRKGDLSHHPFLAVCSVVPLFFSFVGNPELGAFRDWDAWSLPAPPFSLWVAALVLNRIRDGVNLSRGTFLICGAAALHSCMWVGVNASARASEPRFVHMADGLKGQASVDAWVAVGNVRRQEKRYPEAIYAYKKARDADPSNPNRWILVGATYSEMGRSEAAIEYFEKAHKLLPNQAMPLMNLGAAYSDLGQFDKAIEYTRRAIALDPDLAAAHMNLSVIYRKTGKFDKAVQHLEKAAALRRNDPVIHEHLAEMYNDMGENEKAIRHLEKANLLRPRHTRTLVNLALASSNAGNNTRAIELLKKAAELEPGLAAVHLNLGVIYIRIGRHATGIRHLKRAFELQPDNPLALQNIGFAYSDLGKHEQVIPFLQKAIQLDPDAADAHLLLGMTYRALKRPDEARIHLEKTLELKPDHPQGAEIKQWLKQTRE